MSIDWLNAASITTKIVLSLCSFGRSVLVYDSQSDFSFQCSGYVFKVSGEHKMLPWDPNSNSFFMVSSHEFLAWGGGGSFALYLDADLLNGTAAACNTFQNESFAATSCADSTIDRKSDAMCLSYQNLRACLVVQN